MLDDGSLHWLARRSWKRRRGDRFYPEFEAVYEERYQERYGYWHPINGTVVRKFECGDLKHGFARVRCLRCRDGLFVPYSCRVRCFCPSCHEKRALEKAGWTAERVCAKVPHRRFVCGSRRWNPKRAPGGLGGLCIAMGWTVAAEAGGCRAEGGLAATRAAAALAGLPEGRRDRQGKA